MQVNGYVEYVIVYVIYQFDFGMWWVLKVQVVYGVVFGGIGVVDLGDGVVKVGSGKFVCIEEVCEVIVMVIDDFVVDFNYVVQWCWLDVEVVYVVFLGVVVDVVVVKWLICWLYSVCVFVVFLCRCWYYVVVCFSVVLNGYVVCQFSCWCVWLVLRCSMLVLCLLVVVLVFSCQISVG